MKDNIAERRAHDMSEIETNVKEHATLSAGTSVDHGVEVESRNGHENRAADRGCVSRLVLPSSFSWLAWIAASWVILAPFVGGQSYFQTMDTLRSLWVNYPVTMVLQMAAVGILSARLLATRQEVQATDSPNSNSALSGILPPIADSISSRDGFIGGNFLENVKHIHPPISNSEFKKEAEGGLDDAACCASSLLERDGNYDGKRPVYFDIRQEQTTTDKPEHDSYVVILE
jgi:hypothetical protein